LFIPIKAFFDASPKLFGYRIATGIDYQFEKIGSLTDVVIIRFLSVRLSFLREG